MNSFSPIRTSAKGEPTWEVAELFPVQGAWSEEEYLDLTESTNRLIELCKGKLEFLPMPTPAHQRILSFLFSLWKSIVESADLGEVLFTGIRVKSSDGYREPDIAVLLHRNKHRSDRRAWQTADIVLEVISDEGRKRDAEEKRVDYAASGFPEYWIVDPEFHRINVLTLKNGEYVTHSEATAGVVSSALLEGLTCDVDAVFAAAEK